MNQHYSILFILSILSFLTLSLQGQNIQEFGPGVHQDLDHRIETRRICVPNPTVDREYNFKQSFADNVNNAIRKERTAFNTSKIGNYVHPSHYKDPVDYAHKIITALRKAYSQAYGIKVIDIPLNNSVSKASQNHACKMISCNQFAHQSSCLGSPQSRLTEQVGAWGSCLTGYSENIAINTSSTIEGAIEWAIFGMMYDDLACCQNGHRENFLKCTYDSNWRMGFGFQKGKYSFGSNRSYDTWFMAWDYAKKGGTSGCGWDTDKGPQACPKSTDVTIKNFTLNGQGDCSTLKASWSVTSSNAYQSFEVYQKTDKTFNNVATVTSTNKTTYTVTFNTSGKKAEVYVKARLKNGDFRSSSINTYNLTDCKPESGTQPEDNTPEPEPDITDNTPEPSEPEAPVENDPNNIVVVPNPTRGDIQLKNVSYGSFYRIYTIQGRPVSYGLYRNKIRTNRLRAGTYIIIVDGKSAQFIKL